jgi:deoxyribodipyrimidine photolyase-related protein
LALGAQAGRQKRVARIRHLTVVLGDQLDHDSAAFDGFDNDRDVVWMAEVKEESTHVPSHKARTALFLSAMRHFAQEVRERGRRVEYRKLNARNNAGSLDGELHKAITRFQPECVIVVEPGEYRVEQLIKELAAGPAVRLEIRPDRHFFCSRAEFSSWAKAHGQLRMEFFYRDLRKKSSILMDRAKPEGERWNFDAENRKSFGKSGPGLLLATPRSFTPDAITREVLGLVEKTFPDNPGSLEHFDFPVTAADARIALSDFIEHRLPDFGAYQDAMWTDEPYLFHSRISAMMNLKLLNPRTVLMAVEDAYHRGHAPLSAVEGYIRQILGWREYVHGVYWLHMPQYLEENAFEAHEDLPDLYWTGDTDMNCLKQAVGQTLEYGYAHHIQRLMVNGLFSLLFGVKPVEIHRWYLAIYWDAIEWVELPNVLGMSQYADGGFMASKPYVATGKYISRMSNYCSGCRYKPDEVIGNDACPFTTLYWDFLLKHEKRLKANQRMTLQVKHLGRMGDDRKRAIRTQAQQFRDSLPKGNY